MSKDKKLSPKQKKIAAMAGDPNRIEGEDFQKLKTMKASEGEMTLKDFADQGAFEPGSRGYEKAMQDDVDQAVERNKTIKGAKKALQRIKTRESIENMPRELLGTSGVRSLMGDIDGAVKSYFSKRGVDDTMSVPQARAKLEESSFSKGGSVMARGCKMGRSKPTKLY